MALIIDGVHLQLRLPGLSRLWGALLPLLPDRINMPIVLLDRGGQLQQFPGVEVIPYPTYKPRFNPQDSALLERVCRHYGASIFLSTHWTTPLQTPSVLVVADMIPERLALDLRTRELQEKEAAIAHARRHMGISARTRDDLLALYPELDPAQVAWARCGVDPQVFRPPANEAALQAFRRRHDLGRPYFLAFEAGPHNAAYRNQVLLDTALSTGNNEFDVLWVGSAPVDTSNDQSSGAAPKRLIAPDDAELALAYGGAEALVHPSLYEGFGLPVAEAMACGCPVITTSQGALAEFDRDAIFVIDGGSATDLVEAMRRVRIPEVRAPLVQAGLRHAAGLGWGAMAETLVGLVHDTAQEARDGVHHDFYETWARLRSIQGEVDILA